MTKHSTIFIKQSTAYIHPESRTVDGVWIVSEPAIEVSVSETESFGNAVIAALASSRIDVPHPAPNTPLGRSFLKAVGAASWNDLYRSSLAIGVCQMDDELIELTPLHYGGSKGPEKGLHPAPKKSKRVQRDPLILAKAVCSMLEGLRGR